jgi:hypothetical protein
VGAKIKIQSLLCVNEKLLSDTKLRKNILQLLIMGDGTGNAAQMMQATANI